MYLKRLGLLMVISFMVIKGNAQLFNPKQLKLFKIFSDTLVIDSLSLVPGSVYFKTFPKIDSLLPPEINYKFHALIFKSKRPDSIIISYKIFPYNFEKKYFHKNPSILYTDLSRPFNPYTIQFNNSNDKLFQNDGLTKNGNISRGISFGNNQAVVLNSNLNLQVSGKLSQDIDIVLAATDNNIPFQADGTSAQLQEFDKVFIQLNNESSKLVLGDFQLSRPKNSYFMNLYKRAQGIYLENNYVDSNINLTFKTQVSGGISRGKFSRQVFFGIENNQGPYRLKGANNELFIIVLSGTEKIYIDGKLLQRGQENDYIIDYNTGEITFTARQMITKDKRIVAEFQYAERNYARSLFFFGEEINSKKANVYFNFYSEQDNKNKPLQQSLNQDQKNSLINSGDSLNLAFYSGVDSSQSFNSDKIFYKKVDTLINGILYPNIYVYSNNSDNAKYNLKFSNVGVNKGHYQQINSAANGRVYIWKAPMNGNLQGDFEPLILLVTPKQNQMLTTGFNYSISTNHILNFESVYSKNTVNTFSSKDLANDYAAGFKLISKNQTIIKTDSLNQQTKWIYNLNYEILQKDFTPIERFRSIEFERDWNRPLKNNQNNAQQISHAELGWIKTNKSSFLYTIQSFNEGETYKGIKHAINSNYQTKNNQAFYTASLLNTNDIYSNQNTQFYRHKTLLSQNIKKIKVSISDEFENNLFKAKSDLSLLPKAYQFWEWEASISNADSTKNKIKLFYKERRDKLAYNSTLKDSTYATNIGLKSSIYSIKNNPITLLITYRKLYLSNNIVGNSLNPDNTLLNRLEYNPHYFKGFITAGFFFETGYGLENKREFYYLEVPAGQGQYAWIDYNNNNIKELNEFEVSKFIDQAKFIKIYTPTNAYTKVLQNQLSVSFNIRPAAILKNNSKALNRFANRFNIQTSARFDNKISNTNSLDNYNPFLIVKDTFLLANNNNIRQSIFFNQSSAFFGADYTYLKNESRQLIINGIEGKYLLSHEIKWRLNFFESWAINSSNIISKKENSSQFFLARNFIIEGFESEQKLIFQPNTIFRLSSIYKYSEKKNVLYSQLENNISPQKAYINSFGFELKYNQTEKGSLNARFDLIKISYNDLKNTALSYEMLNGLSSGNNFTWELSYQRNINENIQISITYNARKTSQADLTNIGGMQIRAFF